MRDTDLELRMKAFMTWNVIYGLKMIDKALFYLKKSLNLNYLRY